MSDAFDPWEHVEKDGAGWVRYKHGVKMFWRPKSGAAPPPCAGRGDILDQSRASRHRAAFGFGNAECDWLAMACCTWHFAPTSAEVKRCLRELRKRVRRDYGVGFDGWIMEMQKRGVPHFHLFFALQSLLGLTIAAMPTEWRKRKVIWRRIVRGSFDKWLSETWLEITGQQDDADAVAFHEGGIVELFDSPDAAGRYVAKESCKREQKILPDAYSDGLGRWWWLAKQWTPVARERGIIVGEWPFEGPMKHVWEARKLAGLLAPMPDAVQFDGARKYALRSAPVTAEQARFLVKHHFAHRIVGTRACRDVLNVLPPVHGIAPRQIPRQAEDRQALERGLELPGLQKG